MAWNDLKRVKIAALLQKFSELNAALVELHAKSQAARAHQQLRMLQAQHQPQAPKTPRPK